MPTIKLNGKDIEVDGKEKLLKICLDQGAFVPHYCWHPGLQPAGNCRILPGRQPHEDVAAPRSVFERIGEQVDEHQFQAGSVTADQELYGADPKHAAAMTEEALDMILRLWASGPPYEIEGKFWSIRLKKSVDGLTTS